MLLSATLAGTFITYTDNRGAIPWVLTYTPLHLWWAGREAVIVFFVLSGYVLARSAYGRTFTWFAYYPSRLIRLYLPVVAAVLFAAATIALVERHDVGGSWWLNTQISGVSAQPIIRQATLLTASQDPLLAVVWSLKWEVIFSLLLPLFVLAASRRIAVALLEIGVLLLTPIWAIHAPHGQGWLTYLPIFGVGVVMARHEQLLEKAGRRIRTTASIALISVAVVLLTLGWSLHHPFSPWIISAQATGAALLVFAFGFIPTIRAAASAVIPRWLGSRSYSLYLVHLPVLLAIAYLMGGSSQFAGIVAFPAALLAAEFFFRVVESRSHQLARRVRATLTRQKQPTHVQLEAS